MNDSLIKVDELWKRYDIHPIHTLLGKGRRLLGRITGTAEPEDIFWALRDVSFQVRKGETLGIIGPNAAGKSTILKVLCRVTAPTRGSVRVDGRMAPLIQLGAGFQPELTGRENTIINGVILGMSRREIQEKYDQIVEFAELKEFMDTPVKKYSSGMLVRLGLSIVIHVDPEILLIDEILSVGDLAFQNRSLRRLAELREHAGAVVFVSHNLSHVRSICDRVILLARGKILADGEPDDVIDQYRSLMSDPAARGRLGDVPRWIKGYRHISTGRVEIRRVAVVDQDGNPIDVLPQGNDIDLEADIMVHEPVETARFSFGIVNEAGVKCIQLHSERQAFAPKLPKGPGRLRIRLASPNLAAGRYFINLSIFNASTAETYERFDEACSLRISGEAGTGAVMTCRADWEFGPSTSR